MNPEFRPEMTTLLGDSLTVGIVLALVFGAVCFYLYSRMSQNEKRVGLLENLLLSLKMSTEASLFGPDMVEPTSSPAPLSSTDVEEVTEENYAEMLKGLGSPAAAAAAAPAPAPVAACSRRKRLRREGRGGAVALAGHAQDGCELRVNEPEGAPDPRQATGFGG